MTNFDWVKDIENKVENKFKIKIWKLFLKNSAYIPFYKNFIDENWNFSDEKMKNILDFLFNLIDLYNITNIKPNNFSENDFKNDKILLKFWEDIITFLQYNHHNILYNGNAIFKDYEYSSDEHFEKKVRMWILKYLENNFWIKTSEVKDFVDFEKELIFETL